MKVRITKASDDSYWYANRTGEVFEVIALSNSIYKELSQSTPYIIYTILKEDCEEVTMGKFKVGDEVIIKETEAMPPVLREYIGKKTSITKVFVDALENPRENAYRTDVVNDMVFRESELELAPKEQPKKTMNLKEALKEMLDGKQVVEVNSHNRVFLWDDHNSCIVGSNGKYRWEETIAYLADKHFEIYSPPHKYSKGQFIVSTSGDFGKIIETDGHDNGIPKYKLQFTSGDKTLVYTEDKIGGLA